MAERPPADLRLDRTIQTPGAARPARRLRNERMSETLIIVCDVCGARTAAATRTKVRWARESKRKGSTDLCQDCSEELLVRLGKLPRGLFAPPDQADGRPAAAAPKADR